jgi:hypothetical protein
METVKRTGTLLLLMIFLFGITGLSVFRHTCTSSNKEKTAFYAGIFKEAPGSCCGDEAMDQPVCSHAGLPQAFDEPSCCKSTTSFLSLHIISERQDKLAMQGALSFQVPQALTLSDPAPASQVLIRPVHFQFHSPPRYGKQLVHYLHQIKIPAHPELA